MEIASAPAGHCPQRQRCGVKSVSTNLSHVASYARFAIHVSEISPNLAGIMHRTRNKIAQDDQAR
jgi:hypothetical protein